MSYGDSWYQMISSGSTAGSEVPNLLFGSYQGLSTLGHNEVVIVQLVCTTAEGRIWDGTVTNNTGFRISPGASVVDLPPMRVGNASLLRIMRDTTQAASPTMLWTLWSRVAGAFQT